MVSAAKFNTGTFLILQSKATVTSYNIIALSQCLKQDPVAALFLSPAMMRISASTIMYECISGVSTVGQQNAARAVQLALGLAKNVHEREANEQEKVLAELADKLFRCDMTNISPDFDGKELDLPAEHTQSSSSEWLQLLQSS